MSSKTAYDTNQLALMLIRHNFNKIVINQDPTSPKKTLLLNACLLFIHHNNSSLGEIIDMLTPPEDLLEVVGVDDKQISRSLLDVINNVESMTREEQHQAFSLLVHQWSEVIEEDTSLVSTLSSFINDTRFKIAADLPLYL